MITFNSDSTAVVKIRNGSKTHSCPTVIRKIHKEHGVYIIYCPDCKNVIYNYLHEEDLFLYTDAKNVIQL